MIELVLLTLTCAIAMMLEVALSLLAARALLLQWIVMRSLDDGW